jgi:hypothetical protein
MEEMERDERRKRRYHREPLVLLRKGFSGFL